MRRLVFCAAVLACGLGCCKPKVTYVPVPVQVPALPPPPESRVAKLHPSASTVEVIEAYVLDLAAEVGWRKQVEALWASLGTPKSAGDKNGTGR